MVELIRWRGVVSTLQHCRCTENKNENCRCKPCTQSNHAEMCFGSVRGNLGKRPLTCMRNRRPRICSFCGTEHPKAPPKHAEALNYLIRCVEGLISQRGKTACKVRRMDEERPRTISAPTPSQTLFVKALCIKLCNAESRTWKNASGTGNRYASSLVRCPADIPTFGVFSFHVSFCPASIFIILC